MKKLFVLFLCLMAVAGFVSAGTVHPPGAPALEALPGYVADYCAVTPDTVLTVTMPDYGLPGQILAVPAIIMSNSGTPQDCFAITAHNTGQGRRTASTHPVDFPLLC
jgi:hypothetical protein